MKTQGWLKGLAKQGSVAVVTLVAFTTAPIAAQAIDFPAGLDSSFENYDDYYGGSYYDAYNYGTGDYTPYGHDYSNYSPSPFRGPSNLFGTATGVLGDATTVVGGTTSVMGGANSVITGANGLGNGGNVLGNATNVLGGATNVLGGGRAIGSVFGRSDNGAPNQAFDPSDPRDPRYDPRYDPRFDPRDGRYDPRSNPRDYRYDPRYDPRDSRYDPRLDPHYGRNSKTQEGDGKFLGMDTKTAVIVGGLALLVGFALGQWNGSRNSNNDSNNQPQGPVVDPRTTISLPGAGPGTGPVALPGGVPREGRTVVIAPNGPSDIGTGRATNPVMENPRSDSPTRGTVGAPGNGRHRGGVAGSGNPSTVGTTGTTSIPGAENGRSGINVGRNADTRNTLAAPRYGWGDPGAGIPR